MPRPPARLRPHPFLVISLLWLCSNIRPAYAGDPDTSMAFWGVSAVGAAFSVVGGIVLALYHRSAGATDARLRELADVHKDLARVLSETRENYVKRGELDTIRTDWTGRLESLERRLIERDQRLEAQLGELETRFHGELRELREGLTVQSQHLAKIEAVNDRILNLLETRR